MECRSHQQSQGNLTNICAERALLREAQLCVALIFKVHCPLSSSHFNYVYIHRQLHINSVVQQGTSSSVFTGGATQHGDITKTVGCTCVRNGTISNAFSRMMGLCNVKTVVRTVGFGLQIIGKVGKDLLRYFGNIIFALIVVLVVNTAIDTIVVIIIIIATMVIIIILIIILIIVNVVVVIIILS